MTGKMNGGTKMKKLIALLLAAIMVMAIFVGCSSKPA